MLTGPPKVQAPHPVVDLGDMAICWGALSRGSGFLKLVMAGAQP